MQEYTREEQQVIEEIQMLLGWEYPVTTGRPVSFAYGHERVADHGWEAHAGPWGYVDLGWRYDDWGNAVERLDPPRINALEGLRNFLWQKLPQEQLCLPLVA